MITQLRLPKSRSLGTAARSYSAARQRKDVSSRGLQVISRPFCGRRGAASIEKPMALRGQEGAHPLARSTSLTLQEADMKPRQGVNLVQVASLALVRGRRMALWCDGRSPVFKNLPHRHPFAGLCCWCSCHQCDQQTGLPSCRRRCQWCLNL